MKDIFIENKLPYYNEEIKKEYKGMKGSDKVMVELTGYQVAKLYAVMGSANGPSSACSWFKFRDLLGDNYQKIYNEHILGKPREERLNYNKYVSLWESVILEPETPALTEALKKVCTSVQSASAAVSEGYACCYCGEGTSDPAPYTAYVVCSHCGKSSAASAAAAKGFAKAQKQLEELEKQI